MVRVALPRVRLFWQFSVPLLVLLTVFASGMPAAPLLVGTAHAAGFACQLSSVDPHSAPAGSDTGFSFIVTSSTDVIAWIRIISPSGNLVIDDASSDWLPNITFSGSSATFSGDPINPGNPINVNVSAQVGSFSPTSWTVQASNDQTGTGHVNCPGDASVSSTSSAPPVITSISATAQSTTATVSWTTDAPTNGEVDYGTTTGYGTTVTSAPYTTSHNMQLTGLTPLTTYHYQVTSVDQNGLSVTSSDGTFTTSAAPPSGGNSGGGSTSPISTPKTNNSDKIPPTISITSVIPKIVSAAPVISGTASDNIAVIHIEYSTDSGRNWLPVDSAPKLGSKTTTFSFSPLNLSDGSYSIMARAIDGGGNIATTAAYSLVIDRLPPTVGGNIINLGPQILEPDSNGVITTTTGIDLTITLSTVGGATGVNINALDATGGTVAANFALHEKDDSEIWSGLLSFTTPGRYQLVAHAVDGAGNTTARTIGNIVVAKPGVILSANGPVAATKLTVFTVDTDTNNWVVWDGAPHGQTNPQRTNKQGAYNLLLPPGTYYLNASATGYLPANSARFTVTRPTPITATFKLRPANFFTRFIPSWLAFGVQPLTNQNPSSKLPAVFTQQSLVGTTLNGFTVKDINGQTQSPITWLGQPTVISVMSTWVPDTAEQVAALSAISGNQDINTIPVGLQDNAARLRAYNAISGEHLVWIANPDSTLAPALGVGSLPENYFVDRKGVVRKVVTGVLTPEQLLAILSGL